VAVEISCEVQGIQEFQAAVSRFVSSMQEYVHGQLVQWAELVKTQARRTVPVRTGYLQSTIYALVKDWVIHVGAEATYALFVELGTRHMRARPYLWPAIQQYLAELERMVSEGIEAAKSGAGLQ
jgi:HK97 gp10 family phage protein